MNSQNHDPANSAQINVTLVLPRGLLKQTTPRQYLLGTEEKPLSLSRYAEIAISALNSRLSVAHLFESAPRIDDDSGNPAGTRAEALAATDLESVSRDA